jgi:hypothetical protein
VIRIISHFRNLIPVFWLIPLLCACATYQPEAVDVLDTPAEVFTKTSDDVTVSTTILSDSLAERLYGVDLAQMGLQAIWLHIENRSDHSYWLLVSALDANYYAPHEAAALFFGELSAEDEKRASLRFQELGIDLKSTPGSVNEGYVLTPRVEGGRFVIVALAGHQRLLKYGFAVTLPDGDFDFERLDPEHIYADRERPDLDLEQLRQAVEALPCCAMNKGGDRAGDPLNLVVVGNAGEVLAAMARAGWSFTHRIDMKTVERMIGAAVSGTSYAVAPVSPLWFMDRQHDLALQRARGSISQRNHLRLWLAPFRHEGRSVWVGQISRDIGVKATTHSPTLTTHVIDPNVDEARENLLQSMMVAGTIDRFAFAGGSPPSTPSSPRMNLTEDPYYTDGLRLVLLISPSLDTAVEEIQFLEWHESADPHKSGG